MSERNEELWNLAAERAYAEATHDSEIKARAMVYYRAAVIGIGIGPATRASFAAPSGNTKESKWRRIRCRGPASWTEKPSPASSRDW